MKTLWYFPNYDTLIRTLGLQLLINSLHIESKGSWFDSQCLHFACLRDPTFTARIFEISLLWTIARKKNTPLFLLFFISNLNNIFYLKHTNSFDSFLARSFIYLQRITFSSYLKTWKRLPLQIVEVSYLKWCEGVGVLLIGKYNVNLL